MRPSPTRPGLALSRVLDLLATLIAAAFFIWPAVVNRYPILFSDTAGMLAQALAPDSGWDKPWIYGPFLTPFHLRLSLWPAVAGQALLLSAALWLVQATIAPTVTPARRIRHLLVCAILAGATAAPWFASTLMPDSLTAIAVLGLFILAAPGPNPHLGNLTLLSVAVITTIAIASHLAHLILAAACISALALLRWRSLARTLPPFAAAIALLLTANLVNFGTVSLSPYGVDFGLARLIADGPARIVLDRQCPAQGWRLCAWRDRLTNDSDQFLWDPNGPMWADDYGPTLMAPEAADIVRATLLGEPLPVLHAAAVNTYRQLAMTTLGDTLSPIYLDVTVLPAIQAYFPPPEAARYRASRQAADTLAEVAAPLDHIQQLVLIAGAIGSAALALLAWRRNPPLATLAILALVALFANAFSTGALSGPHDRYQARLAWLVVIPPLFSLTRLRERAGVEDREPTPELP